MKLKKIELKRISKIPAKLIYFGTIIALIIITSVALTVIGATLFKSISASNKIAILKSEIAPEDFDITEFKQALADLTKKTDQSNKIDWSKTKNIFLENKQAPETLDSQSNELPNALPR